MSEESPDWFLQAWMKHLGKKQAALVNELGWNKSRANFVWHGRQAYKRADVNDLSAWLGIEPYELLMPPADALALRSLRQAAKAIAANQTTAPADMPAMAAERGRAYDAPTPQRSPTKKAG